MSTLKVQTFEITGSQQARDYADLVNNPDIVVCGRNDFFAASPTPDGMVPIITRVVDYRELPKSDRAVYAPPIA